ncbi:hypothetical protein BKA82DRAFT_543695 [Pisolithus tinctorius]|nr:hypothetical protein BKA82DRAFT_543695 [Pisolithus tinctorius]
MPPIQYCFFPSIQCSTASTATLQGTPSPSTSIMYWARIMTLCWSMHTLTSRCRAMRRQRCTFVTGLVLVIDIYVFEFRGRSFGVLWDLSCCGQVLPGVQVRASQLQNRVVACIIHRVNSTLPCLTTDDPS